MGKSKKKKTNPRKIPCSKADIQKIKLDLIAVLDEEYDVVITV